MSLIHMRRQRYLIGLVTIRGRTNRRCGIVLRQQAWMNTHFVSFAVELENPGGQ